MMNLKKSAAAALACAGLMAFASGVGAVPIPLTQGGPYYLGFIDDGIPSSPAATADYINILITLADEAANQQIGTETYNRVGSTVVGPFPTAVVAGSVKEEGAGFDNVIDVTGYQYIIGKYDAAQAGSLVWYLGGNVSGEVSIPATLNGLGLSHIILFNPGTGVPDGGSVLILLGSALAGLGLLRRKLS